MIERLQIPGRAPSKLFSPLVRSHGWIFVSGQVARDASGNIVGAGDFTRQANQVFSNLESALSSVGLSLAHILQMNMYITDARYRNDLREVIIRHVGAHLPASTLIVVAGLAEPDFLIEIDAVADGH